MQTLSSHPLRPPAALLNAWKLTPSASYCYTPSTRLPLLRLHQQPNRKSNHFYISVPPGREPYSKEETLEGEGRPFPVCFSCFLSTVDFSMSGVTYT